ncbi:hypothetical protein E4U53_006562, partial [Claviceps sorghi]
MHAKISSGSKSCGHAHQLLKSDHACIVPQRRKTATYFRRSTTSKAFDGIQTRALATTSARLVFRPVSRSLEPFSSDTDMNKRSSSTRGPAVTPPKKRKTDTTPKYYAVQAGFRPGVYLTYAECSAQTAGFKGAV